MKLLLVHPGSDVSTGDVYAGLAPALVRQGVEAVETLIRGYLELPKRRQYLASELPARVAGHAFDNMARHVVADLERVGAAAQEAA